MAPEGTTRGTARGGRGRGARGRGRGARGGRGASSTTATSNNATPSTEDVAMSEAPAAQTFPEAPAPASTPSASTSTTQAAPTSNPTSRSSTPRPSTTTRGPGGPKFVPRAIRRSQLSREAIAAQEVAKQEDKAALDARLKRTGRGGRGGPRRARGGSTTFDRVIRGGTGGFGSDIQASANRKLSQSLLDLTRFALTAA